MAGETEHEEVVVSVVASLEYANPVVNVELALGAPDTAGLASIATGGDEPAATRGG